LRRTASFSRFVGTPYNAARSASSMTRSPRMTWIRASIRAATDFGGTAMTSACPC